MIKIFPYLDFSAFCPVDNTILKCGKVVIPGMRCMVEAECPACGIKYYVDLPVGHAIGKQHFVNRETKEIIFPNHSTWFTEILKDSLNSLSQDDVVPKVHKYFGSESIIIINCLDFLYGHSFLKLLNVQRYLNQPVNLGCCVLVPTQLVHLVPIGVAEIWEFPISIKDSKSWYPSLQNWIEKQIKQRKECFISRAYSHPSPKSYDINRFVHNLPDISEQVASYEPIIVWSHREDRLWGKSLISQQRNLQNLYNSLSNIFPNLAFVLLGFGQRTSIISRKGTLIDLRSNEFDVERDRLWIAYMRVADCAVGVHGSNMLLPSALAKSMVELVPRSRLRNIFQATLFSLDSEDVRDVFLKYRYVYGDDDLSDLSYKNLVDIIVSLIGCKDWSSYLFHAGENTEDGSNHTVSSISFLAKEYCERQPKSKMIKRKIKTAFSVLFRNFISWSI